MNYKRIKNWGEMVNKNKNNEFSNSITKIEIINNKTSKSVK